MRGGHQIDIFRALGDQVFHHGSQLDRIRCFSHGTAGNRAILAIFAAKGAAAEENRAAAAVPRQGRFFPFVEHGFGYQCRRRAAAITQFSRSAVCAAHPGTEGAVFVVHIIFRPLTILFLKILYHIPPSFARIPLPRAGFVV